MSGCTGKGNVVLNGWCRQGRRRCDLQLRDRELVSAGSPSAARNSRDHCGPNHSRARAMYSYSLALDRQGMRVEMEYIDGVQWAMALQHGRFEKREISKADQYILLKTAL